jgi:uncharacterized protein YdeI (YjbR/CyaY-like superfamily)
MGNKDPRIDAYIERSAVFAQPILRHVRKVVHRACPNVQETIKWNCPHFDYKGIMCGMAAFKEHCALGCWKRLLIFGTGRAKGAEPMNWSRRICSIADLPPEKELISYVQKAAELNELARSVPKAARKKKAPPRVPENFSVALKKNAKAKKTFDNLSPSCKREYVEWIEDAKREETRQKRLRTAIDWLNQGKQHNWRYMK